MVLMCAETTRPKLELPLVDIACYRWLGLAGEDPYARDKTRIRCRVSFARAREHHNQRHWVAATP